MLVVRRLPLALLSTGLLLALSRGASAHHVMDGATPTNLFEGLLSGLAHPVIGLDHLAFVLALGIVAAFSNTGLRIPLTFIAGSLVGVLAQYSQITLPLTETLVALSVVAVGLVFFMRRLPEPRLWLLFAMAAGVVHGIAYGEAIVSAEHQVLAMYLAGLAVTQFLLCLVAKTFIDVMLADDQTIGAGVQIAGGVLIAIGVVFLTTSIMPA